MVEIIAGKKGKGKTKYLLDKVNTSVESASGNIVYLDKSQKHMHELSNKVRLINVGDYPISNCDEFLGFISGIISRDFDITNIFVDGIFKIVGSDNLDGFESFLNRLETMSQNFEITFVISVSIDAETAPDYIKKLA